MLERIIPDGIMKPFNDAYSHAVVIPANARVLHVSGQVGAAADGTVPTNMTEQGENVWKNLTAILADAGMGIEDIVKQTTYIVGPENFPDYAAVRARYLGALEQPPASTAVFVTQLVMPEWKVEVELVAAKVA